LNAAHSPLRSWPFRELRPPAETCPFTGGGNAHDEKNRPNETGAEAPCPEPASGCPGNLFPAHYFLSQGTSTPPPPHRAGPRPDKGGPGSGFPTHELVEAAPRPPRWSHPPFNLAPVENPRRRAKKPPPIGSVGPPSSAQWGCSGLGNRKSFRRAMGCTTGPPVSAVVRVVFGVAPAGVFK